MSHKKTSGCVYLVKGRPCSKEAKGNPPLCAAHSPEESPLNDLANAVFKHPKVREIFAQASGILDGFADGIDTVARNKPKAPPSKPPKEDPRSVLGFVADAKLTIEMVKERQKALAFIMHPDRGGSDEAMTRVNTAADALIAQLK